MSYNFVSHYKLNANSNDSIGTNNGTDTSISYVSGIRGNSASYNGTTSKITLTSALGTSWLFVYDKYISTWINPSGTGDRTIVSVTGSNSVGIGFSTAGKVWIRDTAGVYWNQAGTSVSNSSWQHFVFQIRDFESPPGTRNRRVDIYKNGVFVETVTTNQLDTSATLQLGVSDTSTYYYSGLMGYTTFGTGILALGEIQALYNGGIPPDIPFSSNFFPYL